VRLTQQLVAEAALLGLGAGIVGALLAAGAFRGLVAALPLGAWGEAASLDWSVFAAAMIAAVLAAAMVAIAPGVAMWRGNLREVIGSSRTGGIAGRGGRLEGSLVVAEVALAVVMAAGAGLLVRSVAKLYAIDPGSTRETSACWTSSCLTTWRRPDASRRCASQCRPTTLPGSRTPGPHRSS
jgi:hypothetical protein